MKMMDSQQKGTLHLPWCHSYRLHHLWQLILRSGVQEFHKLITSAIDYTILQESSLRDSS